MTQGKNNPDILLETSRLLLRRVEEGDRSLFDRIFCDPEMMRYLGGVWAGELVGETLREWQAEWGKHNYWYGKMVQKDSLKPVSEVTGMITCLALRGRWFGNTIARIGKTAHPCKSKKQSQFIP